MDSDDRDDGDDGDDRHGCIMIVSCQVLGFTWVHVLKPLL